MATAQPKAPLGPRVGFGIAGAAVLGIAVIGGVTAALIVLLALLGTPLFAIMGGASEVGWILDPDPGSHLNHIASKIFGQEFADSPVLVTIPLFTFVGYILAESRTPDRLVHAARAVFGWVPGGLAIVCIIASAAFTLLTGASGVTIIAVGGLLYPALRKQDYSDRFSLGLVTTGGSVGLLLPFSLPLLVYSLVGHVDFYKTSKAVLVPGAIVIVLLSIYAAYVASKEKVARERPRFSEVGRALWELKWELFIPVLLVVGLGSGLAELDTSAGLVAFYTVVVEFFIIKDLSCKKDLPRIAKASMSLAGAIILILSMANAFMDYVDLKGVPGSVLDALLKLGIDHRWQFLIVMNIFLLILGMLMEGFSAILVAVPLILPFVAALGNRHPDEAMSPFQLAMIFLLNLEIAYCMPPLGLNLFISSFRFNRPVAGLYRVVMPFVGVLVVGLVLVSYVPWISNVALEGDVAAARAQAEKLGVPPRDAWMLECVQ